MDTQKKQKKSHLLSQDFSGARMILLGLSVLGIGLAIAWIGFLLFAH